MTPTDKDRDAAKKIIDEIYGAYHEEQETINAVSTAIAKARAEGFDLGNKQERCSKKGHPMLTIEEVERIKKQPQNYTHDFTVGLMAAQILKMDEALKEIDIIFDGEIDIDDNGNPNRAMTVCSLAKAAMLKN